jgi:3-hydroxyisobutyrate dehydrogenase-like beta-hydroxyacid dehydrogenase
MVATGMQLGFVGIGRMGGPMCRRLLDAGYAVCVLTPIRRR